MLHLTVREPSRDDVSVGTVDEAHAQPVCKLPALLVALGQPQPVTASCTTMIAHCKLSGLLRPSKTTNLFGATPVQRAHSVQKLSLRARQTVTASTAAARGGDPVRHPREENVAGEFYVDHTCIGGPCFAPPNTSPRSMLIVCSGHLASGALCSCLSNSCNLQTVIHVAGWTQQHMIVLAI